MIEYYTIVGMVLICIIALFGFYVSIRNNLEKDEKRRIEELEAIHELTVSIVELKISIDNMQKDDIIRDKRITKHGEEIKDLDYRVTEVEHKQVHYETLLQSIKNERGK